jgi:3-oxoacid CoA-transferase A subunit
MDKTIDDVATALNGIRDGATVLFGGFGVMQGWPNTLLLALRDHGARDLTIVCNATGAGPWSAQLLAEAGLVRKVVTTFAAYPARETPIEDGIRAGRIACELVSQGTLAERVRAGGAGLGVLDAGRRRHRARRGEGARVFDGRPHVLEHAPARPGARAGAPRRPARQSVTVAARNFHPVFAGGTPDARRVDEIAPRRVWRRDPHARHLRRRRRARASARGRGGARAPAHPRPEGRDGPRAELGGLPPDLMARRWRLPAAGRIREPGSACPPSSRRRRRPRRRVARRTASSATDRSPTSAIPTSLLPRPASS